MVKVVTSEAKIEGSRIEDGEYDCCSFDKCTIIAGKFRRSEFTDCVFDPPIALQPDRMRTIEECQVIPHPWEKK